MSRCANPDCGAPFEPRHGGGQDQRYCCPPCKWHVNHARKRQRRAQRRLEEGFTRRPGLTHDHRLDAWALPSAVCTCGSALRFDTDWNEQLYELCDACGHRALVPLRHPTLRRAKPLPLAA